MHSPPTSATREWKEAVYGGTFDPFCLHHLQLILTLREVHGFDFVAVVPSVRNPFKEDRTSYVDRLNMLELGASGLSMDGVAIVEAERILLHRNRAPIRTWQVLDFLAGTLTNPTFVIGEDLVPELDQWENVEYIRQTYGFHVVPDFGVHATDVRKAISLSQPWEHMVPKSVADYIKLHGLYERVTQ